MTVSKRLAAQEAKVAAAAKKLEEEKAKKRAIETAAKARERAAERKRETRRKILIGSFILERMRFGGKDPLNLSLNDAAFSDWLTRPDDRALFTDATPAPKPAPVPKPATPAPVQVAPVAPAPNLSQFQQPAPAPAPAQRAVTQSAAKIAASDTYLDVQYGAHEEPKALGARFDRERKKWYVPAGANLAPFARWL